MDQKHIEESMIPISVIVPNYNHERYLKERIDSILNQTYQNFELLLLDDASTDNSLGILESYKGHPRVKGIYRQEANSGSAFSQWKSGINLASHQWVWIAESDDCSDPGFLEACVNQISGNPELAMVMTQSRWIREDGNEWYQRVTSFEREGMKNGMEVLKDFLLFENPVKNASAVVFNRRFLTSNDIEKLPQYKWCGDWYLWTCLCQRGNLYFVDRPMNGFRRHEQSASNKLYLKGFLYKEALPLVLSLQNQDGNNSLLKWKVFNRWTDHLFNQYLDNARSGRSRLYLFAPLYYCILMHAFLPVKGIGRLFKRKKDTETKEAFNS